MLVDIDQERKRRKGDGTNTWGVKILLAKTGNYMRNYFPLVVGPWKFDVVLENWLQFLVWALVSRPTPF